MTETVGTVDEAEDMIWSGHLKFGDLLNDPS